jgi:hypothetical protein
MRTFLTLLLLSLFCTSASAQSSVEEFRLGGTARILNDECIRLTPDMPFASGSAWYEKAIDLNQPFEITVCLVLGKNDEMGADGIGFIFHPIMRTGYRGEGMGFAGLVPSLGIEFDTYQNYYLGDPPEDHVAININGQIHHAASITGPTPVKNLEDGNIVAELFGGNSTVFWGVTAATGRKTNFQDICIKKLTFAEAEVQPAVDFGGRK